MRKQLQIGDRIFNSKKEAILYYSRILNSYKTGELLENSDFVDVSSLVKYDLIDDERLISGIEKIQITEVQYKTKCFEIIFGDNSSHTFSFTYAVNGRRKPITRFTIACRSAIQDDLHRLKQRYFDEFAKNGKVKCQETGVLSAWTELNVDHRQPNTLSVIIDRFIELNDVDINKIDYERDEKNKIIFHDKILSKEFRNYHKDKANLRIVRKELNLSRSHQARISTQSKDLNIE
jgi:hypothetical protein